MKFLKFLESNWLGISLFIIALFFPLFLFVIAGSLAVIYMDGSFNREYPDSQIEAKELVGTWVRDCDSNDATTLRFNEDNTVSMAVVFDEEKQAKEGRVGGLLEYAFRAELLDDVDFFERRRIARERVMNLTTNAGINEFVGSYETRLSDDKIEGIVVNWQEVDGVPISDAQIKLTTYLDVHYEASKQRDVLVSWSLEDPDQGFWLYSKALKSEVEEP